MTTLPKYSREYVDSYMDYIASSCRINKKEFKDKLSQYDFASFHRFLELRAKATRRRSILNFICCSLSELDAMYNFNRGLHFCVESIPESAPFNAFTDYGEDLLDKDVYIDFSHHGTEYFIYATKNRYSAVHGVDNCKYTICLFAERDDIRSYNKKETCDELANFGDYVMLYCIDITDGATDTYTVVHPNNVWMYTYVYKSDVKMPNVNKNVDINDRCAEAGIPLRDDLINLFCHVMFCYKFRDELKRTKSKVTRVYNSHKVHTVVGEHVSTDRYVPLLESTSTKYEPKGGHHASPIEHDRVGHFRRSRGRGDYIKVGDEFVYVGNMHGNYSKVKPAHIGGVKTETVKVYKV